LPRLLPDEYCRCERRRGEPRLYREYSVVIAAVNRCATQNQVGIIKWALAKAAISATFSHLEHGLQRLVDLLVQLPELGFAPCQDDGLGIRSWFRRCLGRWLRLGLRRAEFESIAKARAIANDSGNSEPARGLELDFHDVAGLQVEASVELHTGAA